MDITIDDIKNVDIQHPAIYKDIIVIMGASMAKTYREKYGDDAKFLGCKIFIDKPMANIN
jgi:hypothetical protein